ncbi:MAG: cupin domain-containing protein [Anaerolineae bacterium]|nr:cupin domain-containing protein [Anaerolineae bacterium]
MRIPEIIYLQQLAWTPSPVVAGVEVKYFANRPNQTPDDMMILKIEVGNNIRWHVHEMATEVNYVLQGHSRLRYAENENSSSIYEHDLEHGMAFILPAGLWHSFINLGDETALFFSLHVSQEVQSGN